MARIRTNNVFGTLTDNPLLVGALTMNSAGLANLAAVVAPDEAIITLDPNRVNGAPEIVRVTAHTASATVADIQRGQFGTAARQHPQGTAWEHAPISVADADQDTEITDYPGHWTAYTPVNTNITVGNGTETARFCRVGDIVHWNYILAWGTTTSFGGTIQIGLPVNAAAGTNAVVGSVMMVEGGVRNWVGTTRVVGVNNEQVRIVHTEAGNVGVVNGLAPFTWGDTDILVVGGSYEV